MEDLQLHGLSGRTQETCIREVQQLAEYYRKSPDQISEAELRAYFLYLLNEKQVAPSTLTVALSGIKFSMCIHCSDRGPRLSWSVRRKKRSCQSS